MMKMTRLVKKAPGITREDFVRRHSDEHARLIAASPEGRLHIIRFLQTFGDPDAPASTGGFDATDELWFDTEEGMQGVLRSPDVIAAIRGAGSTHIDADATVVIAGETRDVIGDATTEATATPPLPATSDEFGVLPRGTNHLGLTVPDLDAATDFLRAAFDAKVAYDGLTPSDPPREGEETERQLGLPSGARITRQRMVQIGIGPSIEMFEIDSPEQRPAARLSDIGLNHLSLYVDNIDAALRRAVAAGGEALSEPHPNSPHEDTDGNASVYVRTPWGTLFELQSIPGGHWYDDSAETRVWTPPARR